MFSHWRWTYQKIDGSDSSADKGSLPGTRRDKRETFRKYTLVAAATITGIAFLTAAVLSYFILSNPSQKDYEIGPCGNSSAEALARGCSFDQLMWAWYPRYCPHYANAEYLEAEPDQPWRFFVDPYKKTVASEQDWVNALDNRAPVYGERREHLTHCVYMFLSLGQIIRDGTRYTPRQVDYEHLEHCAGLLLDNLRESSDWYQIQTKAPHVFYDQDC